MELLILCIIIEMKIDSFLAIMKFVAEEQTELSTIVFWQMGSLKTSWPDFVYDIYKRACNELNYPEIPFLQD